MPPLLTEVFPPMPLAEIVSIATSFQEMTIDEKKVAISRAVSVHPTLNLEWGGGSVYRRCRVVPHNEKPESVDGLVWRSDAPAKLGRANPEGFQVIYLADRAETALRECRVKDSPVVLTDFVIRDQRSIQVAPIGEMLQIQRSGRGYLLDKNSNTISTMLNASPHHSVRSLLITDAFLHHCFVGQDDHEISSHVALSIFRKNSSVNAIAYPSTQQPGAVNFAVRVEDFWNVWGIKSVTYGHARHLASGVYEIERRSGVEGIDDGGALSWIELDRPDRLLSFEPPFSKLPGG